ncbi:MAG TPA: SGNH/GDSL hydrolase family protein [Tepidisphaeraceae bacterium]|jgi:lysophospholipase L1-like esterase
MRKNLISIFAMLVIGTVISPAPRSVEVQASAVPTTLPTGKSEREIAAFEEQDRQSPPPKGAVLFIGDSGIRMWTSLAKDFPDQKVINRGFGGSTMTDALYYADRIVIPYKPRLIVVREGGNDLTLRATPEQVLEKFQEFVEKVHATLPDTRIAFFSFNPNPARWDQAEMRKRANAMFKAYATTGKNLDFIDVWEQFLGPDGKPRDDLFIGDHMHNNAAGYKIYADAVRPHLK